MKNKLVVKTVIDLILVIILLFLNINNFANYIFNSILLLGLLISVLKKKEQLFILLLLAFSMNSIYLFLNEVNIILLIIYYVWTIFLLVDYFKFVFNLNNKMNIVFHTLVIPSKEEYLIAKFLGGPKNSMYNSNAIVTRNRNSFIIKLEDKDFNTDELIVNFEDIENINIIEKPYFKSMNNKTYGKIDFTNEAKKVLENIDSKIIKSYEIVVCCKNTTVKLLTFDYPDIFSH